MFEQSKEAKEFYLYTKKIPVTHGGVTLPGLFSTRYSGAYAFLFSLAIILEVWGMYNLYLVGKFNPIFAVLLVFLDLLFAVFSHLPQKAITKIRNEMVLNNEKLKAQQLRKRLSSAKSKQNIFLGLIAILALFKSILLWLFNPDVNAVMITVTVAYIVIAFIHIRVTGFIIFEWIRSLMVNREKASFVRIGVEWALDPRKHRFVSRDRMIPANVRGHKLYQLDEENNYILETTGILTDDDLFDLIGAQLDPVSKSIIAREGLHHQYYNILPAEPNPTNV